MALRGIRCRAFSFFTRTCLEIYEHKQRGFRFARVLVEEAREFLFIRKKDVPFLGGVAQLCMCTLLRSWKMLRVFELVFEKHPEQPEPEYFRYGWLRAAGVIVGGKRETFSLHEPRQPLNCDWRLLFPPTIAG